MDLAGLQKLAALFEQAEQVHGVFGIIAILVLQRSTGRVTIAPPGLILVPVLEGRLVRLVRVLVGELVAARARPAAELLRRGRMVRRVHEPTMMPLEAPQLAEGIAGKGVARPLGQEQVPMLTQLAARVVHEQDKARLGVEQLDDVGVAGQGQAHEFGQRVDDHVAALAPVLPLLELAQA